MKKILVFAAAAALAAGIASGANINKDTKELRLSGTVDFDTAAGTYVAIDPGFGYFVADGIELGGEVSYADDDVASLYGFQVFAEYNVDLGAELVPFVGGSLGWRRFDAKDLDNKDAATIGATGGAKYFVSDDLAISGQAEVLWATDDIFADKGKTKDTDWRLTIGLRYYFD